MKNSVLSLCEKVCTAIWHRRRILGTVIMTIATIHVHWPKIQIFHNEVKLAVAGESWSQDVSFYNYWKYADWMHEKEVCPRYKKYYKKILHSMRTDVTLADLNSKFYNASVWLESMRVRLEDHEFAKIFLHEDQDSMFDDSCKNVVRNLEQSVRVGFWELKYYSIRRSVMHICFSRPNLNCVMAVQLACHSICHRLLVWYYEHFLLLVVCDRLFTAHLIFPVIATAMLAFVIVYIDEQHMQSFQDIYTDIQAYQQHFTTVLNAMFQISVHVCVLIWKLGSIVWNVSPHISYLVNIIYNTG